MGLKLSMITRLTAVSPQQMGVRLTYTAIQVRGLHIFSVWGIANCPNAVDEMLSRSMTAASNAGVVQPSASRRLHMWWTTSSRVVQWEPVSNSSGVRIADRLRRKFSRRACVLISSTLRFSAIMSEFVKKGEISTSGISNTLWGRTVEMTSALPVSWSSRLSFVNTLVSRILPCMRRLMRSARLLSIL